MAKDAKAPERPAVFALSDLNVELLGKHGIHIVAIEPLGAEVRGFDLRKKPNDEVLKALEARRIWEWETKCRCCMMLYNVTMWYNVHRILFQSKNFECENKPEPSDWYCDSFCSFRVFEAEMASRGFLVFSGQGILSGEEQVQCSKFWGAQEMHSTHGVHPQAPNRHIFRLSNDNSVGITGVGPQWHNDGSFEANIFSHVGYHIIRVPEQGGDTEFVHQGAAFDALPKETQDTKFLLHLSLCLFFFTANFP